MRDKAQYDMFYMFHMCIIYHILSILQYKQSIIDLYFVFIVIQEFNTSEIKKHAKNM